VGATELKVRIAHPFHPQCGHELEVVCRRQHWGEDRIVYAGPNGALRSIATHLTDLVPQDEFRRVAGGSAAFSTVDLLALCSLLDRLGGVGNA
jgi:hypothetical protein